MTVEVPDGTVGEYRRPRAAADLATASRREYEDETRWKRRTSADRHHFYDLCLTEAEANDRLTAFAAEFGFDILKRLGG